MIGKGGPMTNLSLLSKELIAAAFKGVFSINDPINVTPNLRGEWDYQCPSVVKYFNMYKAKNEAVKSTGNARVMAQKITSELAATHPNVFGKFEIDEKGMIYFGLSEKLLEEQVNRLIQWDKVEYTSGEKKKVCVDFSSPNIAKEMHVGHLRSTILGESLCRSLEFLGHTVVRVNHLGDWGTQFGMLITHMMEAYPDFKEKLPSISDLGAFYVEAKRKFDSDEQFKKRSQEAVVKLQAGDENYIKPWKMLCDISLKEFDRIYKRLEITNNNYGESFYNPMIPSTIAELESKGLVKQDDGAKCVFVKGKKVPLIVVKKDGGYNYDSTDITAARVRLIDWQCNRVVYLTDAGQWPHFELIFEASKMAGWHVPPKTQMEHMGFGLVLVPSFQTTENEEGEAEVKKTLGKIKTRSGNTPKLTHLLDEAARRAKQQLLDRSKQLMEKSSAISAAAKKTVLTELEMDAASEQIGIAAIRYYDLKQNRISNYEFSYDQMLDPKGNTAVYLLYAYARLCSIIRKSNISEDELKSLKNNGKFVFTHEHERVLAASLLRFPETIEMATDSLAINRLCEHIYELATKIAEGYAKYKVIDESHKKQRVLLVEALRMVLQKLFWLVGIKPLDKI